MISTLGNTIQQIVYYSYQKKNFRLAEVLTSDLEIPAFYALYT